MGREKVGSLPGLKLFIVRNLCLETAVPCFLITKFLNLGIKRRFFTFWLNINTLFYNKRSISMRFRFGVRTLFLVISMLLLPLLRFCPFLVGSFITEPNGGRNVMNWMHDQLYDFYSEVFIYYLLFFLCLKVKYWTVTISWHSELVVFAAKSKSFCFGIK